MRNLLSTKDQRQLRLMEILIQHRDWMKLHELADELGCTERILKSDLNELRAAFPTIDIQSSVNGIMIDLEVNTSVEDVYQYFLAHSQSFRLLEYMFFNEGLPIYRTIENLHSSNANLYRLGRNITKLCQLNSKLNYHLLHPKYVGMKSIFAIFLPNIFLSAIIS